MEFLQPEDWDEALEARAAHPGALPLWGGTDVMVDLNFGRERPEAILDLTRVRALEEWGPAHPDESEGALRIGAGVSYTRAITELGEALPGLAAASRTVGSPQIRNRGTLGGNLAHADPASELPACCLALGARMTIAGPDGEREVAAEEFFTGIFETALHGSIFSVGSMDYGKENIDGPIPLRLRDNCHRFACLQRGLDRLSGRKQFHCVPGPQPTTFMRDRYGYDFILRRVKRSDDGLRRTQRDFVLSRSTAKDHTHSRFFELAHCFFITSATTAVAFSIAARST